ncbi:MAG: septum formation initiator family protein [Chloroflexi bacterium]|nr:septum formation initiator family protein [Chloroflexota bacterium]
MNRRGRGQQNKLAGKRRLIVAVLVAVLGLLLFSFSSLALSGYRLNQQAESLQQEIQALKAKNEELQKQSRYLESDEGIEKMAREQLGWVKPGETGIVTVPSKAQVTGTSTSPPSQSRVVPNWQRWWDLFFGG